jgi:GxxExxY protein
MLLAESLTEQVIGLAIEVHRNTGPGLLEAVYEQCLCVELRRAGVAFKRQVPIPMLYKGEQAGNGFKADVVVAEQLIVEIKSVAMILSVPEMQPRTYLRMSGVRVGLLLNFNAPRLMDGLRRYIVSWSALPHRDVGEEGTGLGQLATSPRHVRRMINRSKSLCSGTSSLFSVAG